jgi:histidyl-tRNA synthetase
MFSASSQQTPCVGVSIGIERVFAIMEVRRHCYYYHCYHLQWCTVRCSSVVSHMLLALLHIRTDRAVARDSVIVTTHALHVYLLLVRLCAKQL